ncbi:MAG: PAS domain-containing protein [Muribaculaceae bacterium]|nr:PAS domain-containing protein [Muribaculaceae bacterium]
MKHEFTAAVPDWAWGMNCAITVCDADCRIVYMNKRSRETFAAHGDLIGHNLLDYHPERAIEIIRRLLNNGGQNCYTIEKNNVRKMIFQTAWHNADGSVGGLVELSMIIPAEMPHYIRN